MMDWMCERILCMFKHGKKIVESEHSKSDPIIYSTENINVSVVEEEDVEIGIGETSVNSSSTMVYILLSTILHNLTINLVKIC